MVEDQRIGRGDERGEIRLGPAASEGDLGQTVEDRAIRPIDSSRKSAIRTRNGAGMGSFLVKKARSSRAGRHPAPRGCPRHTRRGPREDRPRGNGSRRLRDHEAPGDRACRRTRLPSRDGASTTATDRSSALSIDTGSSSQPKGENQMRRSVLTSVPGFFDRPATIRAGSSSRIDSLAARPEGEGHAGLVAPAPRVVPAGEDGPHHEADVQVQQDRDDGGEQEGPEQDLGRHEDQGGDAKSRSAHRLEGFEAVPLRHFAEDGHDGEDSPQGRAESQADRGDRHRGAVPGREDGNLGVESSGDVRRRVTIVGETMPRIKDALAAGGIVRLFGVGQLVQPEAGGDRRRARRVRRPLDRRRARRARHARLRADDDGGPSVRPGPFRPAARPPITPRS